MAYKPVVSQNENVVILICPSCDNSGFYCIERFIEEDSQADISRLLDKGYIQKTMSLRSASSIDDCKCIDIESEAEPIPEKEFKKREYRLPDSGRPLLSLKGKSA